MTDRIRHLTITLERDVREDDVESIVSAIKHVRGVAIVEQHVVQGGEHLARQVVRSEIRQKLHEAIDDVFRQNDLRERIKER